MSDEPTPRERLRDAAIEAFARRGLGASLREIAADAGVTAGLFTHHFGTRTALRDACDEEILRRIIELKQDGARRSTTEQLAMLGEFEVHRTTLTYLLRAIREGGDASRAFLDHLIADMQGIIEQGVVDGVVRPSRDPAARARYLTTMQLGGLLLQLTLRGDETALAGDPAMLTALVAETTLPTLELYTEGLLADRALLDAYLAATSDDHDAQEEHA